MATIQLKRDFKIFGGLGNLKGHGFFLIHRYLLLKRGSLVKARLERGAHSSTLFQRAAEFSLRDVGGSAVGAETQDQ